MSRVLRSPWILRAVVLSALVLAGCGRGDAPPGNVLPPAGPAVDEPAEPHYVGLAACGECHAAETAAWTGSHHDLAMAQAADSTVLGDFNDATFTHGGIESRFFRRDGRFLVHTEGADGELAEFELKWTFGWDPLQQYLVEFPDGRLQALGIAWDTRPPEDGGQRWFHVYGDEVIPAGDELHWTMPAQNWNYMCADCHSTGYLKNYDPGSDTFASSWTDVNVACEACHGPGSIHVARAREERLAEGHGFPLSFAQPERRRVLREGATTVSIVGGDSGAMQVEACGRCHARRAPIAADYRHGAPLLDSYLPALLAESLYFADGQILDEVFEYGSFRQSRMYMAGVVCSDCHDPHSLELRADGNAVCTQCHLPGHYDAASHSHHEAGPEAPGCVDCHMPARNYMVVDPRRDHSFRVPRPDLSVELGVTNACAACHDGESAEWSAAAVQRWLGRDARGLQDFAHAFAAGRAGRIEAADSLRRIVVDREQPAMVRATALELLQGYPGPESLELAALSVADPDPAVRRAALGILGAAPMEQRLTLLKGGLGDPVMAVRIEAGRMLAGVDPRGLDDGTRGQLAAALDDYIAAQNASLDRPAARLNLGNLYAQGGDASTAERHYRAALALDPAFEPAYVNLADLLFRLGDEFTAGEMLAGGLAVLPDSALLNHALGLHQVRSGDTAVALTSLARAAELAPQNTRLSYVYAVALTDQGRSDEAITLLERAHQTREADQDVLHALAGIYLQSGNFDAARAYLRKLQRLRPWDTQLEQLLQRLGDEP
jgi:predicted CXXCH cytochrome family protein